MAPSNANFRRLAVAAALVLAAMAAGCSDIYYDRRDTVSLGAGDAVATNRVAQTIDPWPPEAADRNIPASGARMQRAIERYRTNRTTPLASTGTSSAPYAPSNSPGANAAAAGANTNSNANQ